MKSYLTFLSRNKLYTFINVLGLSISLMFVILIANYVVRNLTIDSTVEKKERIYALSDTKSFGTGYWNGAKFKARYPEIEQTCGIAEAKTASVTIEDQKYSTFIFCADTTFFDMFSIKLLEGDSKTAITSKDNVVISQNFANKVFGTTNPIGKTIKFGTKERSVSGVMQNIDNSVLPDADIVMNFMNIDDYNGGITSENMQNAGSALVFLQEREGGNLQSKTEDMLAYLKTYFWPYKGGLLDKIALVPLSEIYFSECPTWGMLNIGDKSFVIILISVGLLILLFAVVNYINLTIAQTGFRAKEMATRRLLGSSRSALFGKLISESLLICILAFVIGFFLAISAEPYANELLQSKISILYDFDGVYLASYICLIAMVALLSGVIPAWIISNFQPIEVVRGTFRRKINMIYGKILISFQNVITIALIAGSITMLCQIRHLINAPMGYNYTNIINIDLFNGFSGYSQIEIAAEELTKLPFVETIGKSCGTPLSGGNNIVVPYGKEKMLSFGQFICDTNFCNILNLKIKNDNKLAQYDSWFLNEQGCRAFEIPENSTNVKFGANMEYDMKIAGVFYDFRIQNALAKPRPCRIMVLNSFEENNSDSSRFIYPWNILVKIADNYDKDLAYNQIKDVITQITKSPELGIKYMEDEIKESYKDQQRTSNIVLMFTLIAIIISSLGLLAISTYFIQQRKMEVAVRKVFGSSRKEILNRLVNNFMKLTCIAFVISTPISWYLMDWWLQEYAYKISLSPFIFLGAGILSSLIAFITVLWQSVRAANENPVDSIKG